MVEDKAESEAKAESRPSMMLSQLARKTLRSRLKLQVGLSGSGCVGKVAVEIVVEIA